MPLPLKPGQIFDVKLPFDRDLPDDQRVVFKCQAITCAAAIEYEEERQAIIAAADATPADKRERLKRYFALIRRMVVGWNVTDQAENAVEMSDENFMGLFDRVQIWMIAADLPDAQSNTEMEKKKIVIAVALRWGDLCGSCGGSRCGNRYGPGPRAAILNDLPCEACGGSCMAADGSPCPECEGRGATLITSCPRAMVDSATWDLLRAADLSRRGFLPVAGGWLDQTQAAMDGIRRVWREEAEYRAEAGLKD